MIRPILHHALLIWLPYTLGLTRPTPSGKPASITFPTHNHIAAGDSSSTLLPSENAPASRLPAVSGLLASRRES